MADALHYLNDENFQKETASGITLVDFFASWCGPCRMMEPLIHELATELEGQVKIAKLDIEEAQRITASCEVTMVPTLILFKDGKEVSRAVGLQDKEAMKRMIQSAS